MRLGLCLSGLLLPSCLVLFSGDALARPSTESVAQSSGQPSGRTAGVPAAAPPADPAAGLQLDPAAFRAVIGQPPAPASQAERDDLAILRWNQRTRTAEGVLLSWHFLNRNLSVFDAAIGTNLQDASPTLYQGLPAFLSRADTLKNQLKNAVARPRPFLSHRDLRPCLPLESGWSFPSGHATWFATAALLLADVVPERRERLLLVGSQGGHVRAYCGVHYPSDVLASQRLAKAISQQVIASPQWQVFRQQVAQDRQRLLVAPPAGLPVLTYASTDSEGL